MIDEDEIEDSEDQEDDDDLGDDDEAEAAAPDDDDDDSDETSLDELLSQRAVSRRGKADETEDEDDIMALSSEPQNPTGQPLPTRVIPVKDRQEFVCSNCHLVKARSQLADADRWLCRDCV